MKNLLALRTDIPGRTITPGAAGGRVGSLAVTARRRIFLTSAAALVMVLAAVATGCGSTKEASTGTGGTTSASSCKKSDLNLVKAGVLTIGTDNPAFPPWF